MMSPERRPTVLPAPPYSTERHPTSFFTSFSLCIKAARRAGIQPLRPMPARLVMAPAFQPYQMKSSPILNTSAETTHAKTVV